MLAHNLHRLFLSRRLWCGKESFRHWEVCFCMSWACISGLYFSWLKILPLTTPWAMALHIATWTPQHLNWSLECAVYFFSPGNRELYARSTYKQQVAKTFHPSCRLMLENSASLEPCHTAQRKSDLLGQVNWRIGALVSNQMLKGKRAYFRN